MPGRPAPDPLLSKADIVYRAVLDRIIAGEFAEGTHLKLGQMADEFGMSHVPVREAMRRLEANGYVEIIRNKGVRVQSLSEGEYAMTLETLAVLEGAATAQGYLYLRSLELSAAHMANDRMKTAFRQGSQGQFLEANGDFHAVLVSACPNQVMRNSIARLSDRLTMIRNYSADFDVERAQTSCSEHDEILKAIGKRFAASTIERKVRQHRLNSIRY